MIDLYNSIQTILEVIGKRNNKNFLFEMIVWTINKDNKKIKTHMKIILLAII